MVVARAEIAEASQEDVLVVHVLVAEMAVAGAARVAANTVKNWPT